MITQKPRQAVVVNDLKGPKGKVVVNDCPKCGQVRNIIKGFGRLTWYRISGGKPDVWIIERAEKCSTCEFRTFLNVMEWSIEVGMDFVKQKLLRMQRQDLPINHEPKEWDALWCAKCKCFIEAKIRDKDSFCLIKEW